MNHKINKIIIFLTFLIFSSIILNFAGFAFAQQPLKSKEEPKQSKYKEAWEQYKKEINFLKNSKQEFSDARKKIQQSKKSEDRKELDDKAKNFLGTVVSSMTKKLEAMRNWLDERKTLSEEEKAKIAAEIDKDINWLKERAAKVDESTSEQIKDEAKTVRQYWRNHQIWMKKIMGRIRAARLAYVINKAEDISGRVKAKIEELEKLGKDTAQLETWLMEYDQFVLEAKGKYEAAQGKFQEMKIEVGDDVTGDVKTADDLYKAGQRLVKEVNDYIRKAQSKLTQIVKEIKKMGKSV